MSARVFTIRHAAIVAALLAASVTGGYPVTAAQTDRPATVPAIAIPPPRTAWNTLLRRTKPDGRVDATTAVQAFSLAIGPLPGVQAPQGAREAIPSGSAAVRWVAGYWDELTAAQRAAVIRLLQRPALSGADALQRRVAQASIPLRRDSFDVAKAGPQATWQQLVDSARQQIAAKMGRDTAQSVKVIINATQQQGNALAYTDFYDAAGGYAGKPVHCDIHINPAGQLASVQAQLEVAAHETFHCFQNDDFATGHLVGSAPNWEIEGQAEWVGATIAGSNVVGGGYWSLYFLSPGRPLFVRDYDALGFYAEVAYVGINPWLRFDGMLKASTNDAAYALAIAGLSDDFEVRWASSYARSRVRDPALDPLSWDSAGPGITNAKPQLAGLAVGNGITITTGPIAAYTNTIFIANLTADIVQASTASVHGHVSFANRQEVVGAGLNGYFCTLPQGCTCPKGSSGHAPPTTQIAPGKAYVSMSGGQGGASLRLTGMSLASRCQSNPTPTPSPTGTPPPGFKSCDALLSAGDVEAAINQPVYPWGSGSVCYYAIRNQDQGGLFTVVTVIVWPPSYAAAVQKGGGPPNSICSSDTKPGTCAEEFVLKNGTLVQVAVTLKEATGNPGGLAASLAAIVRSRL